MATKRTPKTSTPHTTKAAIPTDNRQRQCSASKCDELRSTARGILCAAHERQWRREGFRLTPEATKRAKARLAEQAKARAARKPAAKPAKKGDNVVRLPIAAPAPAEQPDARAIAPFATMGLAEKARAQRVAQRSPKASK